VLAGVPAEQFPAWAEVGPRPPSPTPEPTLSPLPPRQDAPGPRELPPLRPEPPPPASQAAAPPTPASQPEPEPGPTGTGEPLLPLPPG
jgi:hypothetical protein